MPNTLKSSWDMTDDQTSKPTEICMKNTSEEQVSSSRIR